MRRISVHRKRGNAPVERDGRKSPQPVLAAQALDAGELAFIRRNQGAAKREGMRGDEEIVSYNQAARLLSAAAKNTLAAWEPVR